MEGFFDNVISYLVKGGTELLPQLRNDVPIKPLHKISYWQQTELKQKLVNLMNLAVDC